MCQASVRVVKLRQHALNKHIQSCNSDEAELLWSRGWMQSYDAESSIVRRAKAKAHVLRESTPVIDESELIAGKPCYRALAESEKTELDEYRKKFMNASLRLRGLDSHMAIDYEKLLKLGISGVQEEIAKYRSDLNLEIPEEMEKDEFYKACLLALDAVISYSEHYGELAWRLSLQAEAAVRKSELQQISRNCRKVPKYPADSFYEALQSIHFFTMCLGCLFQLGRPDRYLLEFYRRDLRLGILTKELAQELIDCFCVMFNEYVPAGVSVGFMVGGSNAEGEDVTNELSYLFIESIGHTRMIYPSIGLCYTRDTPSEILEMSMKLLSEGLSHPAIFNDDVIIKGLKKYNIPAEEACLYIHSTCVEITPVASSGSWVSSPYINVVQLLLDMLGIKSKEEEEKGEHRSGISTVEEFNHFEEFKEGYRLRLAEKIRMEAIEQNRLQMERFHHGGDPLVSCFVHDCLSKGRDIDQGGARYNWIMPSFVGLANLIDSLIAIKKIVFEEKTCTLSQMAEILRSDFEGYETLRMKILNRIPKYGNDIDEVDVFASEITEWIVNETAKYVTYRNDRFIPSLFCWVKHEQLGRETVATPDGRLSGMPLGDGAGPAQGREKKGPTASIISSTKWDHYPFIGGIAVNMKFTKNMFAGESLHKMTDMVKTYMDRGGFEIQINVVDRETLLKARESPHAYSDLVVRVGGYSDYFTHLSTEMQEEIIMRTEHEI